MKILLAHNYYRSTAPSGEDAVFRNEKQLLQNHGFDVITYEKFNDELADSTLLHKLKVARNYVWSWQAYSELTELLEKERPDVAHFHNTFPQISPSGYDACVKYRVPVIQTLHNFRFICPGAMLLRDEKPCELCLENTLLSAVRYRCYRDSLTATLPHVLNITLSKLRKTYETKINTYVALTRFAASKMIKGGIPREKIAVKPNFLVNEPAVGTGAGGYALYVGRLKAEKGVTTLVNAWQNIKDIPLIMIGDGELRSELEAMVNEKKLNVRFLGMREQRVVYEYIGNALMLIAPSICYEGFPMVVLEAYASGTPVIASQIGSLGEIVTDNVTGLTFQVGNQQDLARKVQAIVFDKGTLLALRKGARREYEQQYSMQSNLNASRRIYEEALASQ